MFTQLRLTRRLLPLLLALLVAGGAVAACGPKKHTTSSPTISTTAGATPASCASVGTRKLPKTRLLADLGISAGAFHRYIYKPIKTQTFQQSGKLGKVKILAKGAVAALAIKHFMGNAIQNARSDATLCKYVPTMSQVQAQLGTLASRFKRGDTSGVDQENGLFSQLQSKTGFVPNDNTALPTS